MSPTRKFNNHYDRKMYNRKRHRRRSAEARALEEPQYRQQVIETKDGEKWSYNEYLREQEEYNGEEIDGCCGYSGNCDCYDDNELDAPVPDTAEAVPDDQ